MNYKIVQRSAFSIVGVWCTSINRGNSMMEKDFRDFRTTMPIEQYEILENLAEENGIFGVFSRGCLGRQEYFVAVVSSKEPPEGFSKREIPATSWVVFESSDKTEEDLYGQFYTEWLPNSGYENASKLSPMMEFYPNAQSMQSYSQLWFPILSEADIATERKVAEAELVKLEVQFDKFTPTNIDLKTLVTHVDAYGQDFEAQSYKRTYTDDGKMTLFVEGGDSRTGTTAKYSVPLKIKFRAKHNGRNIYANGSEYPANSTIRCYFGGQPYSEKPSNAYGAWIIFQKDGLYLNDPLIASDTWVEDKGLPANEFVDIEWIIGKTVMGVRVNGELRYVSRDHEYIHAFSDPNFTLSGHVYPAAGRGATVTFESLQITHL